jgi:hypothetical protein
MGWPPEFCTGFDSDRAFAKRPAALLQRAAMADHAGSIMFDVRFASRLRPARLRPAMLPASAACRHRPPRTHPTVRQAL